MRGLWATLALWSAALITLFEGWSTLAGVALAAAALVALATSLLLLGRADPDELRERNRENEQQLSMLGRAMGRASGGWEPRRPGPGSGTRRRERP